jgi:hypothetical protein
LELKAFSGVGVPAEGAAERLREMKQIARRFSAHEFFQAPGHPTVERYALRLVPQPIHRYSDPQAGLVDGALFLLSYGVNPEVLICMEAFAPERGASAAWRYGLARISFARAHVFIDDVEVWTQPALTTTSSTDSYCLRSVRATTKIEEKK